MWHFLWKEDSVASWIANVILAFVVIKFLVYPGLGWMLGSSHPIVAVVSGSMEHDGNFDQWWMMPCSGLKQQDLYESFKISRDAFAGFPFRNGFDKGDIMIVRDGSSAKVGDVIIYTIAGQQDPIIHRVVSVSEMGGHNVYKTKGDHNCGSNAFEEEIGMDQVLGRAAVRVPWLGWIKVGFMNLVWGFSSAVGW